MRPLHLFTHPDCYIASSRRVDAAVSEYVMPATERLHGLKALFVSDIHLRRGMNADRLAALMAKQKADLILLGGDYADKRTDALRLFRALRILRAPLGIYAVCGNNDAEAFGSHAELADAMSSFGCRLLVNESVAACDRLWIGGSDEPRHGSPDFEHIFPEDTLGFRILLSHYPVAGALAAESDLILSGHTHGGQFNFLGLTPYSIGFETLGHDRRAPLLISGCKRFEDTFLLVSKGIGGSRIPLRIGVRPEICCITFLAAGNNC